MSKISVSEVALQQLLMAAVGPPHLMMELQVTMSFPNNPINTLLDEFNAEMKRRKENHDQNRN